MLQSMYTGVAVPGRFARFAGQIQRAAKLLGVPEPVIAMHEDRASPPQRAGDAVGHLTDCERASDLVLARAAFEAAIEESPLIFATREFMELSPSVSDAGRREARPDHRTREAAWHFEVRALAFRGASHSRPLVLTLSARRSSQHSWQTRS